MAFNYSPKIVTDGLILYLDAANPRSYTSGSTSWVDLSRGGNNGTLVNGPTFSSAHGGSIVFDGTNDYVDLGGSLNLKPTTSITVSTWIRFNAMVANVRALSDWHQNGATDRWIFYITDSNTIQWYLLTNSFASAVPFSPVLLNTWYNFTGVYDGISQIFYVNGVFHNSTSKTGTMNTSNTSQPVRLGGQVSAGGYHNGNISTTLIYNRALTATEVLQNYNATKTRFGL
jgi:hypothetical protein